MLQNMLIIRYDNLCIFIKVNGNTYFNNIKHCYIISIVMNTIDWQNGSNILWNIYMAYYIASNIDKVNIFDVFIYLQISYSYFSFIYLS